MSRGKPKRFKKAEIEMAGKLASIGLNKTQIANYFGFSRTYFITIEDAQLSLKSTIEKGRASGIANIAKSLYQKALEGDVACMIFYLKTQAHWSETKEEINEKETYKPPLTLVRES